MSSVPEPSILELSALADKYEALVGLRAARDHDAPAPDREILRALARRHPGSLRELDTLGLPELRRRAVAARQASRGGPREPWMAWIVAFHRLTAAALLVKRDRAAQGRGRSSAMAVASTEAASEVNRTAGFPLSRELLERLVHPPGGRIAPVVLRELARRFGVEAQAFAETLFPSRRRRADSVH